MAHAQQLGSLRREVQPRRQPDHGPLGTARHAGTLAAVDGHHAHQGDAMSNVILDISMSLDGYVSRHARIPKSLWRRRRAASSSTTPRWTPSAASRAGDGAD